MAVLEWDVVGERFFEAGVDRGVLYPKVGYGVVWNGLVSVNENVSGGEQKSIYLDGRKTHDLIMNEDFEAAVEAFYAPEEFLVSDGIESVAPGLFVTHQPRVSFGFSYRTRIGNDVQSTEFGYKIHLVYNATAAPTDRTNKSTSKSADITPLKWTVHTVPPASGTYKPSAHLILDSTLMNPIKLFAMETVLYGTVSTPAVLPTQAAIIAYLLAP